MADLLKRLRAIDGSAPGAPWFWKDGFIRATGEPSSECICGGDDYEGYVGQNAPGTLAAIDCRNFLPNAIAEIESLERLVAELLAKGERTNKQLGWLIAENQRLTKACEEDSVSRVAVKDAKRASRQKGQ
tara:strand:+ start:631 stop:1020 length:390 start_codon:yes stop_codon:yes gene_type:complete